MHDERSAQSRLEEILGSETRNSIAKHNLIEIVRTDKNRQPQRDETLKGGATQIRGEADAKATEIYARAYTQNPQAAEFYAFLKTLETYHKIFTKNSTLVLSTDSDMFALLKHAATKTTGAISLETPTKPSP